MSDSLWSELSSRYDLCPQDICLGLDRCVTVGARLGCLEPEALVVTAAGTNGKGSVLQSMDAIYNEAGYRRMLYTSPHLTCVSERICLNGVSIAPDALTAAFEAVNLARGDVKLTFFEWMTLSALVVAQSEPLDVLLLEVGLGGRLDAVNMLDADCAIITSIDLDHMDYLGTSRESIAREKAGIFRSNQVIVCSERDRPHALLDAADAVGSSMQVIGEDFDLVPTGEGWLFKSQSLAFSTQESLRVKPENAAAAIQAVSAMSDRLPVSRQQLELGLSHTRVPARVEFSRMGEAQVVFDVSHNPASVAHLCERLGAWSGSGLSWGVFSALREKDWRNMIKQASGLIDRWVFVDTPNDRACSAASMLAWSKTQGLSSAVIASSVEEALDLMQAGCRSNDRCVVFGSFSHVGPLRQAIKESPLS